MFFYIFHLLFQWQNRIQQQSIPVQSKEKHSKQIPNKFSMTNIYFWGKPISKVIEKSLLQSDINCIQTDQIISQLSCGQSHAIFVTQNHQLYALGSNQQGQCGAGYLKEISLLKILLPFKSKIVSVSCGWNHTLILDQLGCLYTSGSGECGATGQRIRENSYNFKQIMTSVRKISAGMDHSLALKGSKVFGWGNNDFGQLGIHSRKSFLSPQQLNIYPCDEICAGVKCSFFITVKGVFGCGLNHTYQLGVGNDKTICYPKSLNMQEELQRVYYGNYTLGKGKSGSWYIWGSGAFGVFKYPTKASFFEGCQEISMGLSFGLMLRSDNIYMWGSNNYGELLTDYGQEVREYAYKSPELTALRLKYFSCGTNFAIGISHESIEPNEASYYVVHSTMQHKSKIARKYSNNKLNKSAFTSVNTDLFKTNNNAEMKSIFIGSRVQQHPKSFYSKYSKGMSRTNVQRQRSFIHPDINQKSHQYSHKALSDHAVHKRKTPSHTGPLYRYQQSMHSLHTNQNYQQSSKDDKYELNRRQLQKKLIQQQNNVRQNNRERKSTKSHKKKLLKYQTDQQCQEGCQMNKQNYDNIEKLRKAIQRGKRSKQEQQQNKQDEWQAEEKRKQFQSYGDNLQRLRELLEQAKAQKESISSIQQQS